MGSGKPEKTLYFIALVPPQPVYQRAWEIKEKMAADYDTKAALKSPPHITLHMPFRMKREQEGDLKKLLSGKLNQVLPFGIELDGFGAFVPRVIYIDVRQTEELHGLFNVVRRTMQGFLHSDQADWKNRGFTPHLTVAFRDLKRARFSEAWAEFRDKIFSASWTVSEVTILRHTGKRWEPLEALPLAKK